MRRILVTLAEASLLQLSCRLSPTRPSSRFPRGSASNQPDPVHYTCVRSRRQTCGGQARDGRVSPILRAPDGPAREALPKPCFWPGPPTLWLKPGWLWSLTHRRFA